jgi:hypothetical protein
MKKPTQILGIFAPLAIVMQLELIKEQIFISWKKSITHIRF